jgi:hypothetical protein
VQYQDLTEMRDVKCKMTYHKWIQSATDAENHPDANPTVRVAPIRRQQFDPPCMHIEKAGDNGRNEQPLKATSGTEMSSVEYFTSESELAVYQKLLQFMLQGRGLKFNNQYVGFYSFTGYL